LEFITKNTLKEGQPSRVLAETITDLFQVLAEPYKEGTIFTYIKCYEIHGRFFLVFIFSPSEKMEFVILVSSP
jgi:hypothetical protein